MAYCTRANIEAWFGKANVARWADLDNYGVTSDISARITAAITYADALIDARLLGGPYDIPFTSPPELIKQTSARLAGVWLYEGRGVQDVNSETGAPEHRLKHHADAALKLLDDIRRGRFRFDLDEATAIPEVITEDDDEEDS